MLTSCFYSQIFQLCIQLLCLWLFSLKFFFVFFTFYPILNIVVPTYLLIATYTCYILFPNPFLLLFLIFPNPLSSCPLLFSLPPHHFSLSPLHFSLHVFSSSLFLLLSPPAISSHFLPVLSPLDSSSCSLSLVFSLPPVLSLPPLLSASCV